MSTDETTSSASTGSSDDYIHFLSHQISDVVGTELRKKNGASSRADELRLSIQCCRKLLADYASASEPASDTDRSRCVLDLMVGFKMELEQLEEVFEQCGNQKDKVVVRDKHFLVLQPIRGRNAYCEVCISVIWALAQAWRRCSGCGFRVHDKCIAGMKYSCAGNIVAQPSFNFIRELCPEVTLKDQAYQCVDCFSPIGYGNTSESLPRLCDYTGNYYCDRCHWNDLLVIPARILTNWDFTPKPVSRQSKKILVTSSHRPILLFSDIHETLLNLVPSLKTFRRLRSQIILMKCFLVSCRTARKSKMLRFLDHHSHYVDSADSITVQDLVQLAMGGLVIEVQEVVDRFRRHITQDCPICQGNGFICELCDVGTVIFPFEDDTAACQKCYSVFHSACFKINSKRCPRCIRISGHQSC